MEYNQFVTQVQSFAQLASEAEAQKGIRATLATLAERIDRVLARKLAAQLPKEMSLYLQEQEAQNPSSFNLQEFYQRVIEKEKIAPVDAVMHVRAVFAVLNSLVNRADLNEIQAQLSPDYEELFAI